jgi:hypothetical protein
LKLLLPLWSWSFGCLLSFVHIPKLWTLNPSQSFVHIPKLWTLNPSQSFELLKLSFVHKL